MAAAQAPRNAVYKVIYPFAPRFKVAFLKFAQLCTYFNCNSFKLIPYFSQIILLKAFNEPDFKMRITKLLLLFVALVSFAGTGYAQVEKMIKEADNAYENEAYFSAIDLYKQAYSKANSAEEKARLLFQIAESYRKTLDLNQQLIWYDKALKARYEDPIIYLHLAQAQHQLGQFKDAIANYKKYKEAAGGDVRADIGIEEAQTAQEWQDNPTRYNIENQVLLNTPEYDFSPTWADRDFNEIIFTSSRQGAAGVEIDARTGESYQDLFSAKRDKKGKWSEPMKLSAAVNTIHNEGAAALSPDRDVMLFTRCESNKDKNYGCDIYFTRRNGNLWTQPSKLDLKNDDSDELTTVGHPAFMPDGSGIIFASDMPGGEGGKDLYSASFDLKTGKASNVKNLGPQINTEGNEMFPFVRQDGVLFFSSDGHFGMGGLDIFMADVNGDRQWNNVQNLKVPINSISHDFGIIWEGDNQRGFFSSNRTGGKGQDDIYSFKMPPLIFALEGVVYDKDTKVPVPDALIKVVGSDGTSFEIMSDGSGAFTFDRKGEDRYILPETNYSIEVSKPDYLVAKDQISTVGLNESTTFLKEYFITFTDPNKAIEFPEVRYAYNKAELLVNDEVNSKDSLNFLYKTLVDNPTIIIELQAHTDSRGDNAYNKKLSQERAQSCVNYLISKGIPAERMVAKGYGETRLRISDAQIAKMNTTEEKEAAHQKNRRTEFTVISFDYIPKDSSNN